MRGCSWSGLSTRWRRASWNSSTDNPDNSLTGRLPPMPTGRICSCEVPATDVDRSAAVCTKVFGWQTRVRGDGHTAFDDTTGAVSGSWVLGRKPSRDPGVLAYVMVDDIDATLKRIVAAGGQTATSRTSIGPSGDAFATFNDPLGNLLGLYQEPRRARG